MKKTIIALIALAGGACGASSYSELSTSLKEGMMYAWDFNSGSAITFKASSATDITNANNSTVNKDTTYAELVGSNCIHSNGGLTGFSSGDFTVSIDVMGLGTAAWKTLLYLDTSASTNGGSMQLQIGGSENLVFFNSIHKESDLLTSTNLGISAASTTWSTVTIVSDSTNSTLTLYVDGNVIKSATGWSAGELKSLSIGYSVKGEPRIMGDGYIDTLYVWNRALGTTEVKALVVPEPATATLSLLALCGLAARRRRK